MNAETEVGAADFNALLDGELTAAEAARVRAAIAARPDLRLHFAELQRVQRVAQLALRTTGPNPARGARFRIAIAATIAAVSFGVGIVSGRGLGAPPPTGMQIERQAAFGRDLSVSAPAVSSQTLVHIGGGEAKRIAAGIERVERLLASRGDSGKPIRVEVLLNGGGLVAVRADASPYAERIARLQQRYPNVSFIACRQTMERFKLEHGSEPRLLPGVTVAPSALDQVVHRLEQGWTYVRI